MRKLIEEKYRHNGGEFVDAFDNALLRAMRVGEAPEVEHDLVSSKVARAIDRQLDGHAQNGAIPIQAIIGAKRRAEREERELSAYFEKATALSSELEQGLVDALEDALERRYFYAPGALKKEATDVINTYFASNPSDESDVDPLDYDMLKKSAYAIVEDMLAVPSVSPPGGGRGA